MAGVRSGLRQRVVPSSGDKDKHAGIGSLFWKRTKRETTRRGAGLDAGAAAPAAAAPSMPASTTSSVIHLGKLRIPQSRRLSLTATSARGGNADMGVPVSLSWHERDAALRAARETLGVEEHEEERGRLIEIGGNRTVVPPEFIGGPSVIPFGVGEGKVESGVVQIPLRYTVGQTVDFIRTVATVDRDYSRTATAASASFYRSQEGSSLSSRIYVTENGVLKGYITMATLLTHQPETSVRDLVRELDELLREGDSWEDAAHRLRQANVMAAPVVDEEGVLVAVLNPADLLQEMEIEATDDIMRQSGSGGGESYFGTPLPRLVASRVGWLVSLLCLQSFSSLILQSFQTVIEKNMVIALFLTMLTGTAGNAGNQSSAIVIRGLATGEIRKGNRMRVVWRETRAAVASAFVLSIASFVRVMLTPGATTVATLAVAIAMGATVIGAVMFGTIAPIVLDKLGVDPVNFASPALATLTDVSGVFILCSVAKLMLGRA